MTIHNISDKSPLVISDKPCIDGMVFRSILGEQDADALNAVHTGRINHDKVDLSPLQHPCDNVLEEQHDRNLGAGIII
jgi:hypothetical protein